MKNNVQLITYADRLSGSDLQGLNSLLTNQFDSLFGGVHLLPFYYPIDGSDAGFDPIDHTQVDSRLGNWNDIANIGERFDTMADLIVNHMSAQSEAFQDVLKNGRNSKYWDLFLTKDKVFPNGLSDEDRAKIYRPRPGSCFTEYTLADGTTCEFWTTFTSNQIDIDVNSAAGKQYLTDILTKFAENNVNIIRLDAAGYAIKKAGSSCFMLEETFEFINQLAKQASELGIQTLVEIHSYYKTQIEIAEKVDRVYDFALPPLVLHSIFSKDFSALAKWLKVSPRNCITVLDTHDGIGIIDVGPMAGKAGLLNENEIDQLVEKIHNNSQGQSRLATGAAASNVDLYQVNCTYYDALAQNNFDYLLARAIQFFAPGTPQVYYTGLLCHENDMALLEKSKVGRDINRPYLNTDKVDTLVSKNITQALFKLIKIRNNSGAFNGEFVMQADKSKLQMCWTKAHAKAELTVDLTSNSAAIFLSDIGKEEVFDLQQMLLADHSS